MKKISLSATEPEKLIIKKLIQKGIVKDKLLSKNSYKDSLKSVCESVGLPEYLSLKKRDQGMQIGDKIFEGVLRVTFTENSLKKLKLIPEHVKLKSRLTHEELTQNELFWNSFAGRKLRDKFTELFFEFKRKIKFTEFEILSEDPNYVMFLKKNI